MHAVTWTSATIPETVKVTVAYPVELVCALAALSVPDPLTTVKFTFALFCGVPLLTARAVSGMPTVAPWAIQRYGVDTPMSDAVSVALSVALTDGDELYAPGARVAVTVPTPTLEGVSQVIASPLWSRVTEQAESPPQPESCTVLVELQAMVAPLTGVIPSADSTRTVIGRVACVPTGVAGLSALPSRMMLSVAAAP